MEQSMVSPEKMNEMLAKRDLAWREIIAEPDLNLVETGNVYVAGGGAVTDVLNPESLYWQALVENATNGIITIASVPFKQESLQRMYEFYVSRRATTNEPQECIDERLVDKSHGKEIHVSCGLIGGVQAAANLVGLENELAHKHGLEPEDKNELVSGTEHAHESTTIFVSLKSKSEVINPESKNDLLTKGGLPFNASLPVEQIAKFAVDNQLTTDQKQDLIETMVSWSPRIARVIIGGDHNKYNQAKDKTLIVIDKRGVDPELAAEAERILLSTVQHEKVLYVGQQ